MDCRIAMTFALIAACVASVAGEPVDEETSTPMTPVEVEPDPWIGEEEPLLAGPRLTDEAEERTLVRFEFNGNLRRLDRTPEEAALDALNLPGIARDRADEVLRMRQTTLDEYLRNNLEILLALQRARQAGNKPEAPVLVAALTERLDAVNGPARLRDEIARTLPELERREFHRMIDEYWRALVLDEVQQAQTRRETFTLSQARVRVTLNSTGNELRRAFERQYKPREHVFYDLIEDLSLSQEQEGKVQAPLRELLDRTKSKPSAREVYDLTNKVLPQLDASQRRIWSQMLMGVSPVAAPMTTSEG